MICASKARSVTSKTSCRRLEAVSSGPNSRKLAGLRAMTSRSHVPSARVPSASAPPGLVTGTA